MQPIKVHFGGIKPKEIDYLSQPDGFAEVWLYRDIHTETDTDGNTEFVADGVMFKTKLTENEVIAQKDIYFAEEEAETTIDDLVEALDMLTSIVLGEE